MLVWVRIINIILLLKPSDSKGIAVYVYSSLTDCGVEHIVYSANKNGRISLIRCIRSKVIFAKKYMRKNHSLS